MLKAYKVDNIVVFSDRGTQAKLLAAPLIHPAEYWHENAAAWVALRAERVPELDHLVDPTKTAAYLYNPSGAQV